MTFEDPLARKWDKCTAKALVNAGVGVGLTTGVLLSGILFRRRFWPIPLSVGFSLGMSYEECRRSFSAEGTVIGGKLRRVVVQPPVAEMKSDSTDEKTVVVATSQ